MRSVLLAVGLLLAAAGANTQELPSVTAMPSVTPVPSVTVMPDAKSPRVTHTRVDWDAAVATLEGVASLPPHPDGTGVERALPHLNLAAGLIFRNVATSPVPVLLPFDTKAYLHDFTAGDVAADLTRYQSGGFRLPQFFFAGPSGYDAALLVRPADVPELADIKFAEPLHVNLSGSALLYDLEGADYARGAPVPALDDRFPGIRRVLHEGHLRYTFVRFGAPYVLSLECFDGPFARFRLLPCKHADRVLSHVLTALRVVGGKPTASRETVEPIKIERPEKLSSAFHYYPPGRLVANSSVRSLGGRMDNTVYARIRFPLAEAPAHANSQVFWSRSKPIGVDDPSVYTWRDNFCERRGFRVGQCPGGIGHQGQDIRPAPCKPASAGGEPCKRRHDLVAVHDGAIMRAPRQEAVYLVVNSATAHLRFRYLHMNPSKMDEDKLFSGRLVRAGEVIGQVSNYSRKEAGTSYHLHFDLQVPTKDGWVFVNPYMTLVTAYERLIGERGHEIKEDIAPSIQASVDAPATKVLAEPKAVRYVKRGKRTGEKARASHGKREKVVHSKKQKFAKSCGRRCR